MTSSLARAGEQGKELSVAQGVGVGAGMQGSGAGAGAVGHGCAGGQGEADKDGAQDGGVGRPACVGLGGAADKKVTAGGHLGGSGQHVAARWLKMATMDLEKSVPSAPRTPTRSGRFVSASCDMTTRPKNINIKSISFYGS